MTLPATVSYNSDTGNGSFDPSTNIDTFNLGTLAAGQTVTIAIDTTVDFAAPDGQFTNTASVSSPTSDPNMANNLASCRVDGRRRPFDHFWYRLCRPQ